MIDYRSRLMITKLWALLTAVYYITLLIVLFIMPINKAHGKTITTSTHIGGLALMMEQHQDVYPSGIELLAEVMYHENYCNGERGMYLTGAVVMNRIKRDDKWLHLKGDKTVYDVVYAPGQYSTTNFFFTKPIPKEVYKLACKVAKGTPDVPSNVIYQAMFLQGSGIFAKVGTDYFCYE